MKLNSEYRAEARMTLQGFWGSAALLYFVVGLISCFASMTLGMLLGPFSNIVTILTLPIIFAASMYFLHLYREEEKDITFLFERFSLRVYGVYLLAAVYTILWSLLLLIPGIMKSYSYAMATYIIEDNPDVGPEEAIKRSMRMMEGHRMQLFLLELSFLGWAFLCILTFGIGFFWLSPYIETSRAAFYEDVKRNVAEPEETQEIQDIE